MKSKMIFSVLVIVSFAFFSFADETEPVEDVLFSEFSTAPVYGPVLTGEERINHPAFVRFPGWRDMEIVKHEKINWNLADGIDESLWSAEFSLLSMRDLVLKDFDISTLGITSVCDGFTISFAVDIFYREKDVADGAYQGAISSFGTIGFFMTEDGGMEIKDIDILRFYDSLEAMENGEGFMDRYNSVFVTTFISSLLRNYLSGKQNKDKLMTDFIRTGPTTPSDGACDQTDIM